MTGWPSGKGTQSPLCGGRFALILRWLWTRAVEKPSKGKNLAEQLTFDKDHKFNLWIDEILNKNFRIARIMADLAEVTIEMEKDD